MNEPIAGNPAVEVLFSEDQIARRVGELARQIAEDFSDLSVPLVLIGVLKGAAIFLADLARAIPRAVEIDFAAVASYSGTGSTGCVRVTKPPAIDIGAKNVILVEDILDTGLTLSKSFLIEDLRAQSPLSVRVCALLDKPSRRRANVQIDYVGFTIPDRFVVGYGMDLDERYRNLPYVGALTFDDPTSAQPRFQHR